MLYYAIRLMILALIAFAMGAVNTSEASMLCQGRCHRSYKSINTNKSAVPDCHETRQNSKAQDKKNKTSCLHLCCNTSISYYFDMKSITLMGASLVASLKIQPVTTSHVRTYHHRLLRPPIV